MVGLCPPAQDHKPLEDDGILPHPWFSSTPRRDIGRDGSTREAGPPGATLAPKLQN